MRISLKRPVVVLVLAAVAGGAGACKKKTAEPANTTVTPPAAPPAAAPLTVTSVNLGKSLGPDKRVTSETTTFAKNDSVYASVATSGSTPGTLSARWTFQDGQVVDETTQSVGGAGVTEFHVSKPSGWPTGNYKVEVMLNGAAAQSKEFRVQ